jgi:hypothetical protein
MQWDLKVRSPPLLTQSANVLPACVLDERCHSSFLLWNTHSQQFEPVLLGLAYSYLIQNKLFSIFPLKQSCYFVVTVTKHEHLGLTLGRSSCHPVYHQSGMHCAHEEEGTFFTCSSNFLIFPIFSSIQSFSQHCQPYGSRQQMASKTLSSPPS